MTPRQVLASWSGWGTTIHGDTVADDIIGTLAKHGYRIVGDREWLMQTVAVEIDNECLGLDAPRLETVTAAVVDAVLKEAS